jgi:hypothetical protein
MEYKPKEGVDYIVDLYRVADVAQDAAADDIKRSLNARSLEYHPDRLGGLAPEFRAKGERMARLLNRARVVLLDDDKRAEYDVILTEWEGPTSNDGTPVVRIEDAIRAKMAMKSSAEIEAIFTDQRKRVISMVKHNPKQQAMLGRMLEAAVGEDADELREVYDAALFAEDQALAIEESERGRLLGIAGNERYETSIGYAEHVQLAIESARTAQTKEYQRRAVDGVSVRLALLAGETSGTEPAKD